MLLVVVCIDGLLHDDVILGAEHVELGVLEDFFRVLHLGLSFLRRFALVSLLLENHRLLIKFALQLRRLWVESVIEGQPFAHGAELPETE